MDTQKWVKGSYAGLALVVYLLASQLAEFLLGFVDLKIPADTIVFIPVAVGLVLAGIVFVVLLRQVSVNRFMEDVVVELSKVTWPARKETVLSAVVVLVMIGIASLVLFGFDVLWGSLTQKLLIN